MSESVEIQRGRLLHGRMVARWDAEGECPACSLGQYLQQRPDYPKEPYSGTRTLYAGDVLAALRERAGGNAALNAISRYNDELLRRRVVLEQPTTTPRYEAEIIRCFAQMGITATFTGEYPT